MGPGETGQREEPEQRRGERGGEIHQAWRGPSEPRTPCSGPALAASLSSAHLLCLRRLLSSLFCSPTSTAPHLCLSLLPPFISLCVCLFSLPLWMGLFLHLSLPICHSQCLSVCLCIILPVRSGISGPHVLVSLGIFVSLCPVCLLFSLSLSLSVHLCLSASVSSLGACLSVCPSFHLRQLKTPLMSHLMCSCAILFECCRSDLTVAKGTGQEKWGDRGGPEPGGGVRVCFSVFIFFGAFLFQSVKKRRQFKMIFQESTRQK